MFILVEYVDNTSAVVPLSWLNDQSCAFSSDVNIARKGAKPVPNCPRKKLLKLLKTNVYQTFEEAQSALNKLNEDSDATSDASDEHPAKRIRTYSNSSSSSSEEQESVPQIPDFVFPPGSITFAPASTSATAYAPASAFVPASAQASSSCGCKSDALFKLLTDINAKMASHDTMFNTMSKTMVDLVAEIKRLKQALKQKTSERSQTSAGPAFACRAALPLNTYEELVEFEKTPQEELYAYAKSIGGPTPKKMAANMVAAFYTINLQVAMTWKGKRHPTDGTWTKYPMQTTKIPKIIIGI